MTVDAQKIFDWAGYYASKLIGHNHPGLYSRTIRAGLVAAAGAGGHRAAEPEFFQGLSRLVQAHGIFLGFDEVQTTGGPTGDMFIRKHI